MTISRKAIIPGIAALAAASAAWAAEPARDYPIRPVAFTQVRVADEFWLPRLEINRTVTVPYDFKKCEETGRISNFAKAGRLMEGKHEGIYFNDSDVFKVVEGAAYSLAIHPDPNLDRYLDDLIAKFAVAQEPDGYLYTARTIDPNNPARGAGSRRWERLGSAHELYNVGHMYEAAVAHWQATGKRTFLDVALKNADLVDRVFGPGRNCGVPGHQEIEIGLVKLYRATGQEKYLKLAKFFLDERGQEHGRKLYGPYSQDHMPVVEQAEAVGHAVRACYMYSGMADVAALTGNADYVRAIGRIWEDVVGTKLYLTGGVGLHGHGEGFGKPYDLPNEQAYCETCASIANAMWNHRLFLLTGNARYLDVMERVVYNGVLSGVSLSGDRFFYTNALAAIAGHARSEWFGCSCCPTNVVRFIPSLPGYAYATGDDVLYVNLFIGGRATVKLPAAGDVRIGQETRYPWDGRVKITVEPQAPAEFDVLVRIPGWARNAPVPSDLYRYADKSQAAATLAVNGRRQEVAPDKGFARIRRKWQAGDVIEMSLPMPVRRVLCSEKVAANVGRVAVQRGPVVYCAEWPDNDGEVRHLLLPDEAHLQATHRKDLLGGVTVIAGRGVALRRGEDGQPLQRGSHDLVMIPYYAWAHRGPGQMAVWLAREDSAAWPLPAPTIASRSRASASHAWKADALGALNDQVEPKSSIDHAIPRQTWWDHRGTTEWVQYDFPEATRVSAVEVYWFDDTGRGSCRVPKSWRVLCRDGKEWKPVAAAGSYGVEKDRYNRVTFEPVETRALRLEVQLQEKFSGGILEWRVH